MATGQVHGRAPTEQVARDTDDEFEQKLCELVNRGGSFSGESISSRRSRPSAAGSLGKQASMATIARKLRQLDQSPAAAAAADSTGGGADAAPAGALERRRVNKCFHSYRFVVVAFGGISVGLMVLLRYNITISVLKMVNQTHLYLEEHPGSTLDDMLADGHQPGGEFNWNNEIQQMIMSWYMFAYTLPQMPMAKIGSLIGCRWAVALSLGLCCLSTLLTPYFAYIGWQWVVFLRLINGFGASPIMAMLISLLENWLRDEEISLGLAISQSITVIFMALNPLLCGYLSDIHWSLSFYVPGIISGAFCIAWPFLLSDNPRENALVSQRELEHIEQGQAAKLRLAPSRESAGSKAHACNHLQPEAASSKPDSWTALLRVPSFYAYIALWCLHCSSINAFTFILPTYLVQFMRIEVARNGLYCSIIQSGCIIAVIWPHPFLRLLRAKYQLTDRAARQVVLAICCSIVALTWILVGFFHQFQLVLLFMNRCTQNGVDVIITSTLMLNYARAGLSSIAFSAVNTWGNLSVVLSSTFVGWFLDFTGQSRLGWCIIYTTLGLVQFVIWLIYAATIPVAPIQFNTQNQAKPKVDEEAESGKLPVPASNKLDRRLSVLAQ